LVEHPRNGQPPAPSDLRRTLEVALGLVVSDPAPAKKIRRIRDLRFRRFLQAVERSAPKGSELHVVVEHASTAGTNALEE
jgi:hypothetical protein